MLICATVKKKKRRGSVPLMRSGGSSELVCKFTFNDVYDRHLVVWVYDVVLWWFDSGRSGVIVLLFTGIPAKTNKNR
ncbi:hypothetical protein H5410_035664 [Solanum commersonii]|uniref:Uncharacterized protein n=1 Tax=Solanum commersonii TaxID=4109 RepID=A0A9J5Y4D1_SOLCO|nr:hypothetical protein H5410_035664 [Solanum commersonii]